MSGRATVERHEQYVLVHVEGDPLPPQEIASTLSKATEQAIESQLNVVIFRELPVKQRASLVDFYYYWTFAFCHCGKDTRAVP